MNCVMSKWDIKSWIVELDQRTSNLYHFQNRLEKNLSLNPNEEDKLVQIVAEKIQKLWGDW